MSIFKTTDSAASKFNPAEFTPVIRCSICTGEKVAGFRNHATGKFTDVMLIKSEHDLEIFRKKYGIDGDIEKIY
ncbi:MAG: hypothetical protein IIZ29_03530 [Schwartzia sp.]|nr:hypothetical protein [Schwartzia sp. (in: firmicutes)]